VLAPRGGDQAARVAAACAPWVRDGAPAGLTSGDRAKLAAWFAARLDYAPPLRDLTADGFTLRGAASAALAGQSVGITVYGDGARVLALAVWPGATPPRDDRAGGLNVLGWTQQGFEYWVVSDGDAGPARRLRAAVQGARRSSDAAAYKSDSY